MLRQVTIAPAEERDFDAVVALLRACGLPADDVREHFADFVVARRDDAVCAVAGLERHGNVALLRSVAVQERMRGHGLARALCDFLLLRSGAQRVFLLTTTAEGFFRAYGFVRVPRDAAPEPIRATRQFADLCPQTATVMALEVKNVLFVCTGNSARSILAEAYLNHAGRGRYRAYSAGSRPVGRVNPLALETLRAHGIEARAPASKSWDAFARGPDIDAVITVCDSAAAEPCPAWPGRPATEHWSIPDPAARNTPEAFEAAFQDLKRRIDRLLER